MTALFSSRRGGKDQERTGQKKRRRREHSDPYVIGKGVYVGPPHHFSILIRMAPGDRHCIVPPVRLKIGCCRYSAILLILLEEKPNRYEHQHNQADLSQTRRHPRKSTR